MAANDVAIENAGSGVTPFPESDPYNLLINLSPHDTPADKTNAKRLLVTKMAEKAEEVIRKIPGIKNEEIIQFITKPSHIGTAKMREDNWNKALNKRMQYILARKNVLEGINDQTLKQVLDLAKKAQAKVKSGGIFSAQTQLYKMYGY